MARTGRRDSHLGVVLVSLVAPWLSARRVERDARLAAEGRSQEALAAAESAAALNPLAPESTFAEARAHIAPDRLDRARDVLVDGVRIHPSDLDRPRSWGRV